MASANNLATSTPPRGPISPSTTLVYPVTPSRLSVPAHPAGPRSANRPPSISELATLAKEGLLNGPKDLKHYLRTAQRSRDLGKEYVKAGDLEAAFVEFARAASIVLDILPAHQDYLSLLNESQRHNLGLVRYLSLVYAFYVSRLLCESCSDTLVATL
ncbi:hypothetical protein NEOLEDRAFT_270265 [Neolentinus lepideus HHB14362 ss-1]|uniref:USP8 dimerisation domain-containing protein n=1 Tax=Neolentinus lepideus HHB14362 ss-1 TaxID=1314782 RepID=A0A165T3T6_9AGAM|nr:hypothetical protein NEOLEDRAFT_270265 [Neolentinus lepideus HHB14362 ss-1]